jgi:uncharacterized membrane protein YadS
MKTLTALIKLDPTTTLPCSIRQGDGICGKAATAAYAYQVEASPPIVQPGMWMIQPVCRDCAAKAAAVYANPN